MPCPFCSLKNGWAQELCRWQRAQLTVKRLLRQKGKAYLAPENPSCPKFDITNREYVHVWGVVTYVLHKV